MTAKTFNTTMATLCITGGVVLVIGVTLGIITAIQMESIETNSTEWFDKFDKLITSLGICLVGKIIFAIAGWFNDAFKD